MRARERHDFATSRGLRWAPVVVAAGVAVALRVWVLSTSVGRIDSDEAVVGLMARSILHGAHPVFYWRQAYGGTLEPVAVATLFRVFGMSAGAVKAVPLALGVVAALLVWRVGRNTTGEAARVAGAIFLVYPPAFVWWSTKERGFYWVALGCGLVVLLFALRLAAQLPLPRPLDAAVLGVAFGVGWWTSPQTMFIAAPAVVWLTWRAGRTVVRCWPAVPAAVLGALPWIVWNVAHRFGSLRQPVPSQSSTYLHRLRLFFARLLPSTLGLRRPFSGSWLFGAGGVALYIVALAAFAAIVFITLRELQRGGHHRSEPLVAIALVYPFLFALPTTSYYVGEPRYGLLLAPIIVLLVTGAIAGRAPLAPLALVVIASLLAWNTVAFTVDVGKTHAYALDLAPPRLNGLEHLLDAAGVTRVYADYWIAYPLTFDTKQRIVATPFQSPRSLVFAAKVEEAAQTTFVVLGGRPQDGALRSELLRSNVRFRRVSTGLFAVYFLRSRLAPTAVATAWSQPSP